MVTEALKLNGEKKMKNQMKLTKSRVVFSAVIISVLLLFTISTSTQVNAAYPQGKIAHAMAYDSANGIIIAYGGTTQSAYAYWGFETWTYNYTDNEWTKMNPAEHPYGGVWSQLVYDSESEKMVQFGGHNKEDYASNETWIYDYIANTWTPAAPNNVPRLRASHCMAYDSESDVVIMHGGGLAPDYNPYGGRINYNDTWAYDLNTDTWTNMTPAISLQGISECLSFNSSGICLIASPIISNFLMTALEVLSSSLKSSKFIPSMKFSIALIALRIS
ncbi:MAG: hypothetical protein E3J43_01260 [Candidatus Heimdallarchaeota archaeon]|nr:MAG: hypothetical protein E3J43_01260 [Candidatus Heimdallarchaeota archaeon]